jgi:Bacterial SH3 domain
VGGPCCLNEEQVTEHRSDWWLQPAGGDDRWLESWDPTIQCRLRTRVDELERKLRLRTILLVSTITLCVVIGSLAGSLYYRPDRLTVAVAMAPPTSSPSATWRVERAGQSERSQVWAIGEKWIEANALLHFDAHGPQTPTRTTIGIWKEAIGVAIPEASRGAGVVEQVEYAATDFVNLRAAPNNSAKVLTVVAQGEVVRRTGQGLGWLQVEYGDHTTNDIKGWVYSGHLRRVDTSGEPPRPLLTRAAADAPREAGSPSSSGS